MISLTPEMLRKLQMVELEMMIEVDRICAKNDIDYSLDGGTLLGAFRHNGFIPWDDDADICMTRENYNKFFQACQKDLDAKRFFLQEYRTDPYYRWGYSKIRRNDTLFLRAGQEHTKWNMSICIDIFIYDEVPNNSVLRWLHEAFCFCMRKGLYSEVGKKSAGNPLLRLAYGVINVIPRDFYFKCVEWVASLNNGKHKELARAMTFPYASFCRFGLPRRCFDEFTRKDFEGHVFHIFTEYDLYLTAHYGKWMELPPVEKRKIHPVSAIKFIGEDVIR